MDPTGTLGLLFLPWLVMGTAMGDVTQDRPGIARPIQDPLFRLGFLPARQGGRPAPAPLSARFPQAPAGDRALVPQYALFISIGAPLFRSSGDGTPRGPNSPGDLSLPGDVADLLPSL